MTSNEKELLPSNYFNTDKSVSSVAITADDDLDNISYSSDDTIDLISQARDYYLEDEDAVENIKVLLTETRYHGPTFDPSRLSLSNPSFSSSVSSNSKTPSLKMPYFKIERLEEEPEEKNEEGLLAFLGFFMILVYVNFFSSDCFHFNYLIFKEEATKDFTCEGVYLEQCRKQRVIPASYFLRHMNDQVLTLKHHGLGAPGLRPVSAALMVRFLNFITTAHNSV